MPKVLRIINRFNLGGPTYNAAYLTKYLGSGFETKLVGGFKDESEEKSDFIVKNLGINAVIIQEMKRSINPLNDIKSYLTIKKIIREFKPDIVHTHASKAGTLGRIAAFTSGVPVIIHTFHGHVFHSYFNTYKSWIFKKIEQTIARFTTRIIAISELQKEELCNKYRIAPENKFTVIPLGFDLNKFQNDTGNKRIDFRKKYNLDNDEIAIGIIGRIVPIKNHSFFIEAISELKKKNNKKVRAFIVGDGEDREKIESLIKEKNLTFIDAQTSREKADITFTSWIKNVDLVYAGIDIVALTSLNEGTPVSLIEAQASGKPIVSTRAGGIENTVLEDQTALLSDIGDLDSFVTNLAILCNDPEQRELMSSKGWPFVKERYHYQRLVSDMEKLYCELLAIKKPALKTEPAFLHQ